MGLPGAKREITIGDIIRRSRDKKGLSARALSVQAGLSPSYVGKLEAGEIEPSVRAFARLASILKMSAHEISLAVMLDLLSPMTSSSLNRMAVSPGV